MNVAPRISVLLVMAMLGLVALPTRAQDAASFHNLRAGMSEASIPKGFTKSYMFYDGVIDGDSLSLNVTKGFVDSIQVIYEGKSLDGKLISKQITLAQAVARHRTGAPLEPVLALARGNHDQPTGVVDTANRILYNTKGSSDPIAAVQRVFYFSKSVKLNTSRLLNMVELNSLQQSALDAPFVKRVQTASAVTDASPATTNPPSATRAEALTLMEKDRDAALGSGRRVLALIDHAETWLTVDQEHPEAKKVFCDLKAYRLSFLTYMHTLLLTQKAYSSKLDEDDIFLLKEPLDMKKEIDSRMRQVSAMGYNERLCR